MDLNTKLLLWELREAIDYHETEVSTVVDLLPVLLTDKDIKAIVLQFLGINPASTGKIHTSHTSYLMKEDVKGRDCLGILILRMSTSQIKKYVYKLIKKIIKKNPTTKKSNLAKIKHCIPLLKVNWTNPDASRRLTHIHEMLSNDLIMLLFSWLNFKDYCRLKGVSYAFFLDSLQKGAKPIQINSTDIWKTREDHLRQILCNSNVGFFEEGMY